MAAGKPCPGLNKRGCGTPIISGGYCEECRREYQRDRYRTMRKQAALPYNTREHIRTSSATLKCNCCGNHNGGKNLIAVSKPSVQEIRENGAKAEGICDQCAFLMLHVHNNLHLDRLRTILAYHAENPLVIKMLQDPDLQYNTLSHNPYAESARSYHEAVENHNNPTNLSNNYNPITTPRPVVEVWEDPNHFMYGRVRLERAESGNLEALEELRTWWDNISIETLETLTSNERLDIKAMLRTTELQVKTKTDEQITTDPEIKEELISEDEKALEILRNYEFIPAGPPDMSKPIPSPFDD